MDIKKIIKQLNRLQITTIFSVTALVLSIINTYYQHFYSTDRLIVSFPDSYMESKAGGIIYTASIINSGTTYEAIRRIYSVAWVDSNPHHFYSSYNINKSIVLKPGEMDDLEINDKFICSKALDLIKKGFTKINFGLHIENLNSQGSLDNAVLKLAEVYADQPNNVGYVLIQSNEVSFNDNYDSMKVKDWNLDNTAKYIYDGYNSLLNEFKQCALAYDSKIKNKRN